MILRSFIVVVSVVSGMAQVTEPQTVRPAAATQSARVPQPPPVPSPVQVFRDMLAMTPEQRVKAMEGRQPKTREFLASKLKEFEALKPEERENRLRTMELRWHLLPLMGMAPSNRVLRIQGLPERDRPLIEERLRLWDKLSPEQQRDVLECEPALAAYASTGRMSTSSMVSPLSTNQQERINKSTTYLINLHPEKRAELYQNFQEFFELSGKEKAKALDSIHTLSEAERRQMERTVETFDRLPRAQREQCIVGFQKFTALSAEEQGLFIRSAARWEAMSPRERQIWRSLVRGKAVPQPPLPPGFPNAGLYLRSSLASTNR